MSSHSMRAAQLNNAFVRVDTKVEYYPPELRKLERKCAKWERKAGKNPKARIVMNRCIRGYLNSVKKHSKLFLKFFPLADYHG